ncbi:MAG: trypsin-like peptidase domain-containing protein, partial [Planctomycetaceae bacterium]|nr:trypsin-like peptidase domain-containing protein [Planctomycetaceae bacterium]
LGAPHAAPAPAFAFDVKRADASVVRVLAVVVKEQGGRLQPVTGGTGTGFVIDREHVATNYHVIHIEDQVAKVEGGKEYIAVREPGSKQNVRATVVWKSKELDLAVLKVPGLRRDPLTLSSATPMDYPPKGAKVYALGYPGISDQALQSEEGFVTSTLTSGVVGKTVRAGVGGTTRPVIQHDAAINTGNSGGPLFDNCNVVVGVNTFVALSRLQVMEDDKGQRIATGATSAGISLSPHVGNLIAAVQQVPALKDVRLQLSSASDCADEAGGVPVWLYAAMGVFALMAMTGMIVAFTRRREVVRVVESEGGAPVPGAVVEATATLLPREGRPLEGEWIAGPDGTVSVGPLPAAPVHPVHLTARRAEEWHSSDPVAVEDVAGTLEIPLPPVDAKEDVVVEGIVLLPDGSPAAGARLTAWSSGWGCLSLEFGTPPRADFRGRFRIEVPSWSINLSASLVKDGRSYEAFVSAEVEEGVRSLAGLEVRLRDEALEAAGLAEDGEGDRAFVRVAGPDGAPVPQGRVHFHFLDYEDGRTSEGRTLLDGRAAALAPTDEPVESLWIEVVEPADAEGRPLPLAHGTFGPFALSPGRTEIEVRLSPARTLAGLVLDPDGRGIPGLGVAAAPWLEEFVEGRSWSAGTVSLATTDAEGRFLLDRLGDRDYEVTVGLGRDRAPAEPVRARPGGEDLRFVLGPAVAAVVRVLDAGGRPVKEARVEARSPLHDISALTDAEGKVRLAGLDPTRPYRLSVDPPRKRDDLREAVIPDWRPADVVVALPASVVLVVTVRDPRGAPLEGIFVGWESAEEPGSVRGGTTDGDGTVRLRDLPAGALRIEAGLPGAGGSPARVAAATVDSGAGKVDLVLDPGPGTVLRLAAGIDPRLVLVSFARGGDLEPVQAETGKDGRIHLRGLAPGEDYNVFLRDLDTGRCALLRGVRAGDAEREVALAEGKEISGKVHLPPGADSFNVAVLVGKTILIDGEPGEGGAFRFPSVPPGTWTLVAYLTTEDGAYHAATAEVAAGGTVEIRVP